MALSYAAIRSALEGERLPAAFVDLDALERNVDRHVAQVRAHGKHLRVASKSLRVVALLRLVMERGGASIRGVMCYAAEEAEHLAAEGFDDLLIAYPIFREADVERVARLTEQGITVSVAADSQEGIARLAAAGARRGVRIKVVLCTDMALSLFARRAFFGVRRSPLRTAQEVLAMARYALDQRGASLHGLLGYEAQVAGLGDASPFEEAQNPVKALIKRLSVRDVARRRAEMVGLLAREGIALSLVNGGGTGSLDTTPRERDVTEVAAGSGFLKPHLFDYYRNAHMRALEPAGFFAIEVTRRPTPEIVTCLGGGYVASGPVGPDKAPRPHLPEGVAFLPMEMAGEVQTPLRVPAGTRLELGDPVVMRHAKAGELAERFNEYLLVRGDRIEARVPTYRGQGKCFF